MNELLLFSVPSGDGRSFFALVEMPQIVFAQPVRIGFSFRRNPSQGSNLLLRWHLYKIICSLDDTGRSAAIGGCC
jgi:hypothetical protein